MKHCFTSMPGMVLRQTPRRSVHQKLNGTRPLRKLRDRAMRYSGFFRGPWTVGPVGDFLEFVYSFLYYDAIRKKLWEHLHLQTILEHNFSDKIWTSYQSSGRFQIGFHIQYLFVYFCHPMEKNAQSSNWIMKPQHFGVKINTYLKPPPS